jgi:hypothetical protein
VLVLAPTGKAVDEAMTDGAGDPGLTVADRCYSVLGEGSSRAMLYVAVTRGRHNNEAFLYQRLTNKADHEHSRLTFGEPICATMHLDTK